MTTGAPSGGSLPQIPVWEPGPDDNNLITRDFEPSGGLAAQFIQAVDACLRRYHRVQEFTRDRRCLLRLGKTQARSEVVLRDGTRIATGETIGVLHFWNEHLVPFPSHGPDLIWAKKMTEGMRYSLGALARYVETEDGWRGVRAFYACAPLSANQRVWRAAGRFGFELAPMPPSLAQTARDFGDSFVAFALTLAFNPAALRRRTFLRNRHELWVSRQTLLMRYPLEHGSST